MNILNTYFDKIYCINLKKRIDRWDRCEHLFSIHNLTVQRFDALFGLDILKDESVAKEFNNCPLLPGEIGCLYSHYECLLDITEHGYKKTLIFEDDIEFSQDFQTQFRYGSHDIPKWDMLYLGGNYKRWAIEKGRIVRLYEGYTTHAYGITNEFAKIMVEKIQNTPLTQQIDNMYVSMQEKYKCYAYMPTLVYQRQDYSDVQNKTVDYRNVL